MNTATLEASWQLICDTGREAAENIDKGRWLIGDLANAVETHYGEANIAQFAIQIGVEKKRVEEYRTVCDFWKNPHRQEILDLYPMIKYSHMRDAMRLKSLPKALTFLEDCAANAYTVEQARIELCRLLGKPIPPVKLVECRARIATIQGHSITLMLDDVSAFQDAWQGNKAVKLKVYEVE